MKTIKSKSAAVPLSTLKKVVRLSNELKQYLPDSPVCTECGGSGFSDDLPDGDECLICDGDGFLR